MWWVGGWGFALLLAVLELLVCGWGRLGLGIVIISIGTSVGWEVWGCVVLLLLE